MEHVTDDCNCEGKTCTKCDVVLCVGNYAKDNRLKSELKSKCKICSNAESKEWREKNRDYNLERGRRYREENPEKVKESGKKYRDKNRPALREREQAYWEKNRERQREKGKRNYQRHKESIKEYQKKYRKENADIIKERERAYRKAHTRERRMYIDQWRSEQRKNKPINVRPYRPSMRRRPRPTESQQEKWKKYYEENKEYLNQRSAQWIKDNPREHAARQAKRRTLKTQAGGSYTAAEFEALCETYDNKCLRCDRSDVKLTADHIMPISMGGSSDISNIQPLCFSCNSSKGAKFIDFRPQNP